MLFNKSSNGIDELRLYIGYLFKSNDFNKIKMDIELAQEDMGNLIGSTFLASIDSHYNSSSYTMATPPQGETAPNKAIRELKDQLVAYIRCPIAFYAYNNYSPNADISHEDSGRKVKIDNENEKIPFEWMLVRDDESTLNKAHKYTERLLKFLEDNKANEPVKTGYIGTDAYKATRSLFINNAQLFDSKFPIDGSRRLFLKLAPFMQDVELKQIKSTLGETIFTDLKTKIAAGSTLSEADQELVNYIYMPLAWLTMAKAIKILPVEVLPNGIFQNIISESQTMKGKKPAQLELIRAVSDNLETDGLLELERLQQLIAKRIAIAAGEEYAPTDRFDDMDTTQKFMRL